MVVFTAVAAAITGLISGAGFAAAFAAAGTLTTLGMATSLLAGGLAIATSRALMPDVPNPISQKDPGVKIQLAPSTDNRVPVFYGRVTTGALAVDAEIKNQNNTMVYVMVIGEATDSGSYTVNKIYRGDAELNFGATAANKHIVQSITDPNATSSTAVAGKMRCRVYANGTASGDMIFPTSATAVAATTLCSTITASTNYEGLVYAVFEIDYDPENGLTGLGTLKFDITNSLSEPSNVLLDYMTNDRYGAGISNTMIDFDSANSMYDYATTQVAYTTSGGSGGTQDRWAINGMLSTYQPVMTNISKICASASTFFTYDPKGGKFKVVPNRAATSGEKSAAYVFDNDNIVGEIKIASTELYSLYNSIEAEFPDVGKKDQTDTVVVSTPSGDRNANEPDNPLKTRFDLVNSKSRAENLANIDLRQGRNGGTIEFEADYEAIQVDVGDVVKVTESTYGYTDKLYRVMRVTEQEDISGMLSVNVIGLEYSDDVYAHANVQDSSAPGTSNISNYYTNIANSNINVGNVINVTDLDLNTATITDPGNGSVVGNIDLANLDLPFFPDGFPFFGGPFMQFPLTIPNDVVLDEIMANVFPAGDSGLTDPLLSDKSTGQVFRFTPGGDLKFEAGSVANIAIPLPQLGDNDLKLPKANAVIVEFKGKDRLTGATTETATTGNLSVTTENFIPKESMASFTAGVQFEDTPATNTTVANGTTFNAITPAETYDLTGAEIGDYSLTTIGGLGGTISGAFDFGFGHQYEITFANATASNSIPFTSTVQTFNITDFPPQATVGSKISTDVDDYVTAYPAYNFSSDMKAANISIFVIGYSDIDTSGPGPRAIGGMKYEMLHVTKGEKIV